MTAAEMVAAQDAMIPAPNLAGEMQRSAGMFALGNMSDGEFAAQVSALKNGLARLDVLIKEVLVEGVDVITIPGVKGKVLSQAGAEKLCMLARLVPDYGDPKRTIGSGEGNDPAIHYVAVCSLHLGNQDGPVVGQASGSANSHEPRYRYRGAGRECPNCHKTGTLFKSKYSAKPPSPWAGRKGWYCFDKKNGCGVEFADDDTRITEQQTGQAVNPDPLELDNTLLKMACKRALTSCTKAALGGSARFTVDLEEPGAAAAHGVREVEAEVVTEMYDEPKEAPKAAVAHEQPKPVDERRQKALADLARVAPARGFKKLADFFADLQARSLTTTLATKLDSVPTMVIERALHEWVMEDEQNAPMGGENVADA